MSAFGASKGSLPVFFLTTSESVVMGFDWGVPGSPRPRTVPYVTRSVPFASGATGALLYPLAVGVSAVTVFASPWLIRASGPVALFVVVQIVAGST